MRVPLSMERWVRRWGLTQAVLVDEERVVHRVAHEGVAGEGGAGGGAEGLLRYCKVHGAGGRGDGLGCGVRR